MSFDGVMMHAIGYELQKNWIGAKVERAYQQEKDEILLHLRNSSRRGMLLLSASGNSPRIYMTNSSKENPKTPPMFCMLLRKHLVGARLETVKQYALDRILTLSFSCRDEMGVPTTRNLSVEIMGKHSNIVLTDDENRIIDAIKRVNSSMSSLRELLPGRLYDPTVLIDRKNPLKEMTEDFYESLMSFSQGSNGKNFLMKTYTGISPLLAREILYRAGLDETRPLSTFSDEEKGRFSEEFTLFFQGVAKNGYHFQAILEEEKILAFSAFPLQQYQFETQRQFPTASELLEFAFTTKDLHERLSQKSQALRKNLKNHLSRAQSKLQKLNEERDEALDRERWKVYGDVLAAHAHEIPRGSKEVTLENFYDPDLAPITIPLDDTMSAQANVTRFYKKYSKLKHAAQLLEEQIDQTKETISYVADALSQIDFAESPRDIDDISSLYRQEFHHASSKRHTRQEAPEPMQFETPSGKKLYVGKNHRQNEEVTFSLARREDLWFHVKDHPGSHVLLKSDSEAFTNEDMLLAARLAAYFSTLRQSGHADVDYTLKKYVTRHPSRKKGLVTYTNFKTVYVPSDVSVLKKITRLT